MSSNGIPTQFTQLLRVYNSKLSDSSIKTRWSQYKTLCRNIDVDPYELNGCNFDLFNSHLESITNFIDGLKTTDSQLNYTVVAVVILKALIMVIEEGLSDKREKHSVVAKIKDHSIDELDELESEISVLQKKIDQLKNNEMYYSGKVTKLKEKRTKEKESGTMTQKQKDNYIPFEELKAELYKNTEFKLNEFLKRGVGEFTINEIMEYQAILLCRLMLVAPSRTDFGDLQIIRSEEQSVPKDKNYVYLAGEDKYIQLNKWKTKKDVGSFRRIQLNTLGDVEDILLHYCEVLPAKQYIFENFSKNKELQPMTASSFSKYVSTCYKKFVLNRSININLLRHIIVTYNAEKIKEVAQLQNTLGHGAKTQGEYIFNIEQSSVE